MPPAVIDALGETDPIEKSCVCVNPLPFKITICGLPGALSVKVNAPTLADVPVGLNVTLIEQFVEGCSAVAVQLSVSEKSPLAEMLVNVIGEVPSFVAMIVCGAEVEPAATLPKFKLEAESVSVEVKPARWITCGLSGALSFNVIDRRA